MCSSSYLVLSKTADTYSDKFNKTMIAIDSKHISLQHFYENVHNDDQNNLYYQSDNGKKYYLSDLLDSKKRTPIIIKKGYTEKFDTVYTSIKNKKIDTSSKEEIIYQLGANDSLTNMPFLGTYRDNILTVRHFVSDDPVLQKRMDQYNDALNCTYRHELQHYNNMVDGLDSLNSYPIKYVEMCLDEVSANIAQCLEQRDNYIKNNKDLSKISSKKFTFLKKDLKDGTINSDGPLSIEEQKHIANSVFDYWMKVHYKSYAPRINIRTIHRLDKARYMAVLDDFDLHDRVMNRFFNIDGYDFWQYIKPREQELFDKITPEQKATFDDLKARKFRNMDHFETLEYLQMQKGKIAQQDSIRKNLIIANAIKFTK